MGYVINFEPLFYNGNQITVGFGEDSFSSSMYTMLDLSLDIFIKTAMQLGFESNPKKKSILQLLRR